MNLLFKKKKKEKTHYLSTSWTVMMDTYGLRPVKPVKST